MTKANIEYFVRGFNLANKSLELYVINIIFWSLFELISLPQDGKFLPLALPVSLLALAYNFSMPQFLAMKQKSEKIKPSIIISATARTLKRLILLIILGLILLFPIVALIGMLAADPMNGEPSISTKTQLIIGVVFATILSPFYFTNLFFSLENRGLFRSLVESVRFSFKNGRFWAVLVVAQIAMAAVVNLIPSSQIWRLLSNIVQTYMMFVIFSATFLYYQKNKKRD